MARTGPVLFLPSGEPPALVTIYDAGRSSGACIRGAEGRPEDRVVCYFHRCEWTVLANERSAWRCTVGP